MKSLFVTMSLVSFALLLGRLSGFLRDLILAGRYGVTEQADIVIVLLSLPDFTVGLLLAGGFSAVLTPRLCKAHGQERQALARYIAVVVGLAFSLLAGCLALWSGPLLALLAPSASSQALSIYEMAMTITLISLPVAALTGVFVSFLNANEIFVLPNLGTLAFNASICVFLIAWWQNDEKLLAFASAIIGASLIRLSLLGFNSRGLFRRSIQLGSSKPGLPFWSDFGAGVLSLSLLVAMPIIFRTIYATGGEGNLAIFNYSYKLFELPSALIFGPLVTILLPRLSKIPDNELEKFQAQVLNAIKGIAVLSAAIIGVWLCVGEGLTKLIFLRGAMSLQDVLRIAETSQYLFLALPFAGVTFMTTIGLNALGLPRLVLRNSIIAAALATGSQFVVINYGQVNQTWLLLPFLVFYFVHSGLNIVNLSKGKWTFVTETVKQLILVACITFVVSVPLLWGLSRWIPEPSILLSCFLAVVIGILLVAANALTVLPLMRAALAESKERR
ncbi:lipid II flippase MurJ [Cohaesibacter celericrescens]|uniref:Virulence factor MviN n=1 Tax=Cohaesibacter celericrescens TaxID=2067669 RepID=A0A2N5XUJ9_9HYPH|nr:lipid II flippase MurJ [Cohaesibacter celericrescens]PLW78150.1 hypothetical protein C0081_05745 [Cohaesibacter celericrescens]